MTEHSILVTGGAGYIGSSVARQLGEAGENIVVLDNLNTGFRSAVLYGDLVVGDTGDQTLVREIIHSYSVETIMHFAAHTVVPESVRNPLKYYGNNTSSSRNLLECALEGGIRHFIFSSTAAVYGNVPGGICTEESPTTPINPYGTSKLMTEYMIRDTAAVNDLNYISLRYFNVAGCDPECRTGQSTKNATLLTKVACQAAVGKRDGRDRDGTDDDTPEGTGIRDYIHVEDLGQAHIDALNYLRKGGESDILNCGYGHGFSVREVIAAVEKANGSPIKVREGPRREGDPDILISNCDRIKARLGWKPRYDDLDTIVASALNWEKHLVEHPAR